VRLSIIIKNDSEKSLCFNTWGNIKINSVHRARGGWVKKVRKKYLDGGCQDIFWGKKFFLIKYIQQYLSIYITV